MKESAEQTPDFIQTAVNGFRMGRVWMVRGDGGLGGEGKVREERRGERWLVGSLPATGGKRTAIRPRKMSPEHIFGIFDLVRYVGDDCNGRYGFFGDGLDRCGVDE